MKPNEMPLSHESQDLFVVPRSDKQASQVVASEEVNVETEVVCVNEEEDVNLNEEERVVAERREFSVEISSVPATVEDELCARDLPGC
ncbi:hypothetical protein V6N13_120246 [Hibiscus sabdariffa]